MACNGSDVSFSKAALVDELLLYRANIEATDPGGNTPLLLAAGTGLTDVVKRLIEHGANVHATNARGVGA